MFLFDWIKKINKFIARIINFTLLAIIYFIGGTISWISYKCSKKPQEGNTYWTNEIQQKNNFRRQI